MCFCDLDYAAFLSWYAEARARTNKQQAFAGLCNLMEGSIKIWRHSSGVRWQLPLVSYLHSLPAAASYPAEIL